MSRKIITFCVTIILLLTCSYTVFAEELDQSKTGSISVTLIEKKQNEPIVGAELSVYYVATVYFKKVLILDFLIFVTNILNNIGQQQPPYIIKLLIDYFTILK